MPTKQQVREWMQQRQAEKHVPPTPEEVRRQLGWGMLYETKPVHPSR